jgi:hypothetical protein
MWFLAVAIVAILDYLQGKSPPFEMPNAGYRDR